MNTLIIGGSRGIGWELAKIYSTKGEKVTVTGRKKPEHSAEHITFKELDLSNPSYINDIDSFVAHAENVDRLIFSPGYYQEGTVTDLAEHEILDMIQVCGSSFIFVARAILKKQNKLQEAIVITSSSQWTPRKLEPIYNFAKAGVAHFAHGLSLDERVEKVLVAGPTGTKTAFHKGRDVDMSTYHEPEWVAQQIFDYSQDDYGYKFIKILRDPASVEVADKR
ncbi:MAG TPA: SDR family NAD(P)-dependent oxidoreductase [Candidatus Saccharimonadales bacterium]|nr:SDR family NAD(P)-dependent oxidoreductase [Candidatus Saccharimonadales bacterium]